MKVMTEKGFLNSHSSSNSWGLPFDIYICIKLSFTSAELKVVHEEVIKFIEPEYLVNAVTPNERLHL